MDKVIAKYETAMGADGKIGASIGIEGEDLAVEMKGKYPLKKVVEPATQALDNLLDKLKAAIPGTWDDKLIDQFKLEYKQDLVQLIKARA